MGLKVFIGRSIFRLWKIGPCIFAWALCLPVFAQARLVLDGAKINIHSGGALVIANPAADAIVRNSGHIISEGENNTLRWHIGTTDGTFLIPWGVGSDRYIPLLFTKSGGEGNGFYAFSTYATGWRNSSSLPAAIPRLEHADADMSALTVDRFWQVSPQDYSARPSAAEVTFTYLQEEVMAEGNTILEDNLLTYRWNESLSEWDDYTPGSIAAPANNTVTMASVEGRQFYSWWFLADITSAAPLPVELLFFRAEPHGGSVRLEWATASEQNSGSFTVERSRDGKVYEAVSTIKGAGASNIRRDYATADHRPLSGTAYYRLRQTDLDGTVSYSRVEAVEMPRTEMDALAVYPNPTTTRTVFVEFGRGREEESQVGQVELFDVTGKRVPVRISKGEGNVTGVTMDASVKPGLYILQVRSQSRVVKQKVIVQ